MHRNVVFMAAYCTCIRSKKVEYDQQIEAVVETKGGDRKNVRMVIAVYVDTLATTQRTVTEKPIEWQFVKHTLLHAFEKNRALSGTNT